MLPLITFTGFLLPISHMSLAQARAVLSGRNKTKNNFDITQRNPSTESLSNMSQFRHEHSKMVWLVMILPVGKSPEHTNCAWKITDLTSALATLKFCSCDHILMTS